MADRYDPSKAYPKARKAYEDGRSMTFLRRRLGLSKGEIRDVCPEEYPEAVEPEGNIGGY